MTLAKEGSLRVQDLPVDALEANPWNPNKLPGKMYAKLKAYLQREGFVQPIVVRRLKSGTFQIINGYHRWKIAGELGLERVPCVVVKLNDRRARILSINLNEMKGESAPDLLAELIHDLGHDLSVEDLESQLPYDLGDLRDLSSLLKIPDGLSVDLDHEVEVMERERTRVMSFPLTPEQSETIESAIETARKSTGTSSKSAALTFVAREFLREAGDP